MEKDRSGKIIAIVALLIGVVGLTIGFAAFANTLTISSGAEYNPSDSIFNVDFSGSSSSLTTTVPAPTATGGASGSTATIDNSTDPTISDIKASFTAPGQTVTYEFYVRNVGEMEAFLRNIDFSDASPTSGTTGTTPTITTVGSGFKTCTQLSKGQNPNPATVITMTAACEDITFSFSLGTSPDDETFSADTARNDFASPKTQHDLSANGGTEKVTIVISYPAGSDRADGDFEVNFGDIQLMYASTAS